jgi:ribosome-associated protein
MIEPTFHTFFTIQADIHMTTDSAAKKDIQKLQRVIVDALENVKAQEIVVFDTEKLSALFERVMIASGTSNRQTRALAMSVRDAVNQAGFGKPRVEGEDNGEWIIVDCGAAVVHVMQPAIRSYYNLEELWGETPVRLKFGAEKVAAKSAAKTPAKKLTAMQEALVQIDKGDKAEKPMTLKRSNAAKTGVAEAFPSKAAIKKEAAIKSTKAAAAKKIAAKTASKSAPAAKKAAAKTAAKTSDAAAPAVKKVAAKKAPAKKVAVKKA